MAGEFKTYGILLKKTLLANDDGILEFFTSDFGRMSIFIKKLAKSPKKLQEIDFFRLLELIIFEGRNSKTLRTINTISLFHTFEKNYRLNEIGFQWLEKLHYILPEDKPCNMFFKGMIKLFSHVEETNIEALDMFFYAKCLAFSGLYPSNLKTSPTITQPITKTLESLRIYHLEDFLKNINHFSSQDISQAKTIFHEIESRH